ncbi:MAG: hypothetical protein U0L62_02005 [Paludibacteraceae bacterium]|nr:hypothetical protein [Paludibacteraceae bacterium]
MTYNKQTIKLNENQLRQMVKNSLNEFINGIRPNARPEHPNFSVSNLAYEIQYTLEELQDKGEHLDDLIAQVSPEMFDGIGVEIQRFGADIMAKAGSFLQQFQGDNYINESKLRKIIKESIKNILREGYLNDGDQDIREILANLAYNAIKQVCPQCADHFTPLGGNGNSCGVYVLLSPYDMELSDKSQQKLEQWSDEQKKYALYCFESDYPDFKEKHKTPEYADAFYDYYERNNFDSAIGRIEIHIKLEGAMEGKGWCMYDVKHVTGIEVTVNSFVYDEENNNETICSDCLYKKNINFGDTENDVEYFSHIPEWLQKDINDSLIEAATVIKNIW